MESLAGKREDQKAGGRQTEEWGCKEKSLMGPVPRVFQTDGGEPYQMAGERKLLKIPEDWRKIRHQDWPKEN